MRVCFMGTPDFGVKSLERLVKNGWDICAVVTQPDRAAGRGKKLQASPVKVKALELGLEVLQFERMRSREAIDTITALAPHVCVTAAYGQILSKEFLDIPPYGVINVHGSLLPKYRGAAPIQWAVINGETKTGITTMYTDVGMDTGDILLQRELQIGDDETSGELFERMSDLGAEVLIDSLELLKEGKAPRTPQNHQEATHSPMIKKDMAMIDFSKSSQRIHNLVRGMHPWPVAFTSYKGTGVKVHRTKITNAKGKSGEVITSNSKQGLVIGTGDGAIEIVELQVAGSKRMDAKAYLLGREICVGSVMGE